MNDAEEPALFALSATECEERLARMFAATTQRSFPIRISVGAALLLAEAATQRISLDRLRHMDTPSPAFDALPPDAFETVEKLTTLLFEPQKSIIGAPLGIDLVRWDAEGYVFGWYLDEQGKPCVGVGSCAQTVNLLSQVLRALAPCDPEWQTMLERRAADMQDLLSMSRDRALSVAAGRVASQNWFSKLFKPTTVGREMLSLGFHDESDTLPE